MKKIAAALLFFAILLLPVPAFAAPDPRVNESVLSFYMIEQELSSHNVQISLNNQRTADMPVPDNAGKTALQNQLTAVNNQIAAYNDEIAILQLTAATNATDAQLLVVYQSLLANSMENKMNLESQINDFDANRTKAADAKYKASLETDSGNKQLIWSAEQLFLNYNALNSQIKQQENQLLLLKKQLDETKLRQKLGLATTQGLNSIVKSIRDIQNTIRTMNDQQKSQNDQLNIMLNQNYTTELSIIPTPDPNQALIQAMMLETDTNIGVTNSLNIRSKDSSRERDAEERKFRLAMKDAYQNVLDMQESLALNQEDLALQRANLSQAQAKYRLGRISRYTLDEQQINCNNKVLTVQIAKENLFKAYRQYEWLKKGLSL